MRPKKQRTIDNNTIGELAQGVGKKINNLNCGGCGVFAVELYKRLKGLELGVEPQLWILSSWSSTEERYREIREMLRAKGVTRTLGKFNDYGWYLRHVIVEFAGGWFDGTGFYQNFESLNDNWGCKNAFKIEFEDIETMVSDPSGWNDRFDREEIPEMRKWFARMFSRVEGMKQFEGTKQLKLEF